VAGFVVVADLHLAEQADGEQVQAPSRKPMAPSSVDRERPMTGTCRRIFSLPANYEGAAR